MSDEEIIYEKIKNRAEECGFKLTDNAVKIAKAKLKLFGVKEWDRCPCDGSNPERFCCSQLCQTDIRTSGTCHCRCYTNK